MSAFPKTDFFLKVGDEEIYFYKHVLIAESDYFKGMLSHDMVENKEGKTILEDDYADVALLLDVIHPRKPSKVTIETVFPIFRIAHKYHCPNVIESCLSVLSTYHAFVKTTTLLINQIIYLNDFILENTIDEEICNKLQKIMLNPIDKLIDMNIKLDDKELEQLPKDLLLKMFCRMHDRHNQIFDKHRKFISGIDHVKEVMLKDSGGLVYVSELRKALKPVYDETGLVKWS